MTGIERKLAKQPTAAQRTTKYEYVTGQVR